MAELRTIKTRPRQASVTREQVRAAIQEVMAEREARQAAVAAARRRHRKRAAHK